MIVIKDPQIFCSNLDWPKCCEKLTQEIEFIIKSNESLAKNKIKKRD